MSNYPIIEHMEASLEGCKQMIHDYEQLLNYVKTIEYANAYLEKKNAKLNAKIAKLEAKHAKCKDKLKKKNNIVMEMEPLCAEDLNTGYVTDDDQTWGIKKGLSEGVTYATEDAGIFRSLPINQ